MTKNVWGAEREGLTPLADWSALPILSSSLPTVLVCLLHLLAVSQHLCVHFIDKFPFPLFLHLLKTQFHLWIIFFLYSDRSFSHFLQSMFGLLLDEHENRTERHDSESQWVKWIIKTNYKAAIKYAHFNQPCNHHV